MKLIGLWVWPLPSTNNIISLQFAGRWPAPSVQDSGRDHLLQVWRKWPLCQQMSQGIQRNYLCFFACIRFHALNSTKTRIIYMDYFQGHLAFLSNNQSKWICNILCGLPYSHLLGGASTLPPSINVHHHMHSSHIYLCQHAAPVIICYHAFTIVEWCYQWTLSSMIHHQMFVEVDRTRGGWILA